MSANMLPKAANDERGAVGADEMEYVTLTVGDQLFGLPIQQVQEVFSATQITGVPLAPRAVRGLLNLRGRVVTALCLRTLLGLPRAAEGQDDTAIGIENEGEQYALLIDRIGDVIRLPTASLEPNPIHMDASWQSLSRGVHRLEGRILVVLELDKLISGDRIAA
jgi:purine-binding chemotaxis protein CheW